MRVWGRPAERRAGAKYGCTGVVGMPSLWALGSRAQPAHSPLHCERCSRDYVTAISAYLFMQLCTSNAPLNGNISKIVTVGLQLLHKLLGGQHGVGLDEVLPRRRGVVVLVDVVV